MTAVVLAGGGTAGHVEPALATADALRSLEPDVELTFLGTPRGLEARLVPARGYRLVEVPAVPVPRRPSGDLFRLPLRLRSAVAAAGEVLRETDADVVVGFGGYVSAPAYLAARAAGVPVVVHEANARPGWANRLGARFAVAVATASPEVPLAGEPLGIPLRRAITGLDRAASRAMAREEFDLPPTGPVLLVFGGSQGARRINDTLVEAAPALAAAGISVLHGTGAATDVAEPDWPATAGPAVYRCVPYIDRMDLAYAAADLVVSRCGALTVAELTAVGLPAVYVPLPIGNGEQRLNAAPVVDAGGGLMLADEDCTAEALADLVLPLLADPPALARMAAAARERGRLDADVRLAGLVLATARTPR